MKLIHKLVIGFLLVALLNGITGYLAVNYSRGLLNQTYRVTIESIASDILDGVEREIQSKIEIFLAYSHNLLLQKAIKKSNSEFAELDNKEAYIERKDREWVAVPADTVTPFMQDLMNNELARELKVKKRLLR